MNDTATDQDKSLFALFKAIASNDRRTVSHLLADSPELARKAAEIGATRAEAATYFLSQIGHYAYSGDTALHIAAAAYEIDIARELVSGGALVRARNRRGAEPLHYASDGSPGGPHWNPEAQQAIIKFLIKSGADPDCQDKDGVTPLHRAVRTRCANAVNALLLYGAAVRLKNKSGSTPLHLAVQNTGRGGSGSPGARNEQKEIIKLLIRHGAKASDRNSSGKSVSESVKQEWIRELL